MLLLISNLIRKSVSLPKFFTETSPKFIEFKLSLRDDTLILLSVDLSSIKVPPLKSIPKLRPLKVSKNNEITTKDIAEHEEEEEEDQEKDIVIQQEEQKEEDEEEGR